MSVDKSTAAGRNSGIDLMKVLMTLFVCILHIINQGGAQQGAYANNSTYILLITVKSAVVCAVNGFAMISGYVGCNSKYRFSRIIWLYVTVMIYNFIIPPVIYHSYNDYSYIQIEFDSNYVLKGLFPVVFCTSWYFSAYFGMFFLIPFINSAVKNTDRNLALKLIGCLFFFICFFQSTIIMLEKIPQYDSFGVNYGYSMMWLALMYLAGAIVRQHEPFRNVNKWIFLAAFAVLTALGTGLTLYMYHSYSPDRINGPNDYAELMLNYNSPVTAAQAFCLLLFFSKIRTANVVKKVMIFLVPHTFSIYIIHTQAYIWDYVIRDLYSGIGEKALLTAVLSLLCSGIIVFSVCLLIDYPVYKIVGLARSLSERLCMRIKHRTDDSAVSSKP